MRNLFETLLKDAWTIIQANQTLIAIALSATALIALTIYIAVPRIARLFLRIRHKQTPQLQKTYISLLSNGKIVELYEPSQRYVENLEENQQKPRTNAWLSPYSRAVKASVRRRGRVPKGQYFNARRQVSEASKHIKIRALTPEEASTVLLDENDKNAQFAIVLSYDGHTPEEISKLEPVIRTQLGLKDLISTPDDNPYAATYIASTSELEDALVKVKPGVELFEENPAKTPFSLPTARTSDGKVWSLPTHHTLIYGTTGSGKSGPLYGAIRQFAPFVEKGFVRMYAIDPKASDLRIFEDTSIFEQVEIDIPEQIELINDFYARAKQRTRSMKTDVEKGETNRSIKVSKDTPLNILFIDELFDLRNNLIKSSAGKEAWTNLESVFAIGRSIGFYVFAATQFAEREQLQNLRNNIGTAIILRQISTYLNDLFLGEGAAENGYDSTAIPGATKRTAIATQVLGSFGIRAGVSQKFASHI